MPNFTMSNGTRRVLALICGMLMAFSSLGAAELVCTQEELAVLPDRTIGGQVSVSPNGKRVAYVARKANRVAAVIDGREGRPYDWIIDGNIQFSADSRHTAYRARRGGVALVVFDDTEGPEFASVDEPVLSTTGGHIAYAAQRGGRFYAVIDGRETGPYDSASVAAISPQGRAAVLIRSPDAQRAIIGTHEGRLYRQVRHLVFSPDGRRHAYQALTAAGWMMVIDGIEQKCYPTIGPIAFSTDGSRYAHSAADEKRHLLIVDGIEQPLAGGKLHSGVCFSPDSRHLAYVLEKEHGSFRLVIDGVEGRSFDAIGTIRFTPDSRQVAFIARSGGRHLAILGDRQFGPYPLIDPDSLAVSPDSRHVAFVVRREEGACIVIDGAEGRLYDQILCRDGLAFYADGAVSAIAMNQRRPDQKREKSVLPEVERRLLAITARLAE